MPSTRYKNNSLLKKFSKPIVFGVVLFLVFSPLTQVFQVPSAQAKLCIPISDTAHSKEVADDADCGPGYLSNIVSDPSTVNGTKKDQMNGSSTLATWITNIIYVFTVGLGSLIAYVAAAFFNFAVFLSINSTAYALRFITEGWVIVRDLANMGFIFILIYIAINITLRSDSNNTIKTLVRVLAIALLINFSFFFARIIIDGGNILAVQFYNMIPGTSLSQSLGGSAVQTGADVVNKTLGSNVNAGQAKDLTTGIMGSLNVQSLLGSKSFKQFSESNSGGGEFLSTLTALSFAYISVGVILALLAAAFFAMGVKFISRVVVLWLAIIASPLALLMYAIPAGRSYAKKWQDALVTYSFYPAVMLFLFFIITRFAEGLVGSNNACGDVSPSILSSTFCELSNSKTTGLGYAANIVASIGIKLGLIMILIYLAMKASDMVAQMGGSWAQKIVSYPEKYMGSVGRLPFSTLGFAGRQTVGRAGYNLSRSEGLRNWASESVIGRTLWRGTKKLGQSTFDVRGLPGAKNLKDTIGEPKGKGGFQAKVDAKSKKIESEAKLLRDDDIDRAKRRREYRDRFARTNNGITFEQTERSLAAEQREAAQAQEEAARNLNEATEHLNELRTLPNQNDPHIQQEIAAQLAEQTRLQTEERAARLRRERTASRLKNHRDAENSFVSQSAPNTERVRTYANDMSRRRATNLWWPSRGALAGSERVRNLVREKSENERIVEALQNIPPAAPPQTP